MATTIAGTNCLTQSEDDIVAALAISSPAVKEFLGVVTEADARERIHIDSVPIVDADREQDYSQTLASYQSMMPYVLIGIVHDEFEYVQTSRDQKYGLSMTGTADIRLCRMTPSGDSIQDADRRHKNITGAIMEELANNSLTRFDPWQITYQGKAIASDMKFGRLGAYEYTMMQVKFGFAQA